MTTQLAAWGRLGSDPKAIDTKSGKPMTVATIAADVGDEAPEWFGLVAFGSQAEALAAHHKGETVSASGRVHRRKWTDNTGAEREQLQVIADSLISARSTRPAGGSGPTDTEAARRLYGRDDGAPY